MYITVDVGSTNIRIAGSRDLENLTEPVIKRTPQEYSEGIAHIADTARGIAQGESIDAVAIGIPARLTLDRRGMYKNRNLPDWDGRMIADDIEKALSTRAYLENDTMQVGHGEAVFGAGKGARIVVYMTVSTGVNAVRVVDGKIEPSVYGYETGFQYLSTGESPVDLMDLIAGRTVSEKYGMSPKELGKEHPVWEELARYTAFGLHNTILHWSPERVVLGGSMFNDVGIPIDRVTFHLQTIMKAFPTLPEIVHSSLGDIGGLWGGLARLKQLG
ncbi:hypothetical protein A3C20_00570 [Candidatus Kaiserbacteria bacterium RIFCSPHIGHO2_02_FULL_55_25]|uniref:ROK family protein n=1 Tax=Candidatus Kaiserbacteria bacterium RIFCSPHIGHO2_02_FULL_55_25 TaxID=1798498 RepID=A0A1F6E606_9BACT|nr:MAG: hypothetical protein A2764_02035 [Candidatus Kaiserbacteria bacterium RIFCSPHIGHO2_01_FULL_55_79]OGG69098.1 MAG: hypothetical protein A3C20_00570 [Candidatus Kaiserbacteria bacterium RIFCSPHIGHO2_02_FULL_55_25]OGG78626.1 MAG: hypothetical protein A3F56_00545 [Candidatus Kaiserbacteria bacterium RIFCSPHIGHO2_12_FULL_55_13]